MFIFCTLQEDSKAQDKTLKYEEKKLFIKETGWKGYECKFCRKRFVKRAKYREHVNSAHIAGRIHKCPCGVAYKWKNCLPKHQKKCKVYLATRKQDEEMTKKESPHTGPFICPHCGKMKKNIYLLKQHIIGAHEAEPCECPCGASFKWKHSFDRHKKTCAKYKDIHKDTPMQVDMELCPHCGKTCYQRGQMLEHIRNMHGEMRNKCACGAVFRQKFGLKKHWKSCPYKGQTVQSDVSMGSGNDVAEVEATHKRTDGVDAVEKTVSSDEPVNTGVQRLDS